MPRRRLQRRNFARWTAIGLVFCVAVGFAFVVLADSNRLETSLDLEENLTSKTSEPSIPELETSQVQPEPTLPFEVTEVQNQAPKISLEDLDCWTEMPELSDLVTIQLVVDDPDDEMIVLDLGVLIDERVVDLSDQLVPASELSGSGKVQATFSLPTGVKNYVHLIAHATDSSGAQSEAALILPQNSENCNSE
ncbi:MAG: hypothetical protein CL470_06270 [Acidimicrobiaceae bacterium]|nr:hypothetical protein [Acidimicrobiaceae bacterium]|tara:strand:+ start:718 stop:1296 length:579 start_codon:yes stop_codon:yes gene_type:complete